MGTGVFKVGGNYAASLRAIVKARDANYANVIFLDAKEKEYIDECGPANFFAIKGNTYVTPKSDSILPSITNKCLIELAESLGMKVERRKVHVDELPEFDEAGACGTAAVISPIGKIYDPDTDKLVEYCKNGKPGKVQMKLYEMLTGIQKGDLPDTFNWITILD